MLVFSPGDIPTKDLHAYLLGSVAPRPICFASTIDGEGRANLSPFSFFNVFGSNPPIAVFSPARRVRDGSTKHTLKNAEETKEVVISVVSYDMVQRMNLASCEYPDGVDEFVKAGFTKAPAEMVRPYLVAESPVNLECKVRDIYYTGEQGGAGNLIICEIVRVHIKEEVLGPDRMIDPHKIDLVARMGKDFYCRASGSAVFEVPKPNMELGMGIDQLPASIRNSKVLTGNDLGILANFKAIPESKDISIPEGLNEEQLHKLAHEAIAQGKAEEAWQYLIKSLEMVS